MLAARDVRARRAQTALARGEAAYQEVEAAQQQDVEVVYLAVPGLAVQVHLAMNHHFSSVLRAVCPRLAQICLKTTLR